MSYPHKRNRAFYEGAKLAGGLASAAYQMYGASTSTAMRRQNDPVTVEVAEYGRTRARKSRRFKKNLRNLWRLTEVNRNDIKLAFYAANAFGDPTNCGYQKLVWHRNTTVPRTVLPIHSYTLNGAPNIIGTSLLYPACLNGAWVKTPSLGGWSTAVGVGGAGFGTLADGNPAAGPEYWPIERATGVGTTFSTAGNSNLFKWASIKILFYGRTALPTSVWVGIVRVHDGDKCLVEGRDAEQVTQMLDNASAPFLWNPINGGGGGANLSDMQVVMSKKFTLGSVTSIEGSNTVPHMKQVNFFFRPNMIQRFDWDKDTYLGDVANDEDVIYENSFLGTQPDPRARYHLLIMAQSSFGTSAGDYTWSKASNASYDIQIRTNQTANT